MLVLVRKVGQSIQITAPNGDVISISVQEQNGTQIRIGIEAPKEYAILRDDAGKLKMRKMNNE